MQHSKIARFNARITFQRQEVHEDQYGNHTNEWSDFYSCAAYAATFTRQDNEGNAVIHEDGVITFEVRYCPELRNLDPTQTRVIFDGDYYDIETADLMNYRLECIRIRCRLARPVHKAGDNL